MNEFNFDRSIDIGNNAYVAHFNELLQRFTPRDWETFRSFYHPVFRRNVRQNG